MPSVDRRSVFAPDRSLRRLRRPLGATVAVAMVLALGLPVLWGAGGAVAAPPEGTVVGTVVDADGTPVAGATVRVVDVAWDDDHHAFRDPEVVASSVTDGEGSYAITELLEPGEWGLLVTASTTSGLGAASRDTWVDEDEVTVEDFELRPATLTGVVTRGDGAPAVGAVVEVGADVWEDGFALTDADGSYRLAPEPGAVVVAAHPPTVNPALDVAVRQRVTVPSAGAVDQPLQLRQPVLRGTVLGPDGTTAIAGALVALTDDSGDAVRFGKMRSRSDGSFGFAVPAGDYRLRVTPPEDLVDLAVRTRQDVTVTAAHTAEAPLSQDVTLDGTTLTGVVRDPSGDPVPRVSVFAWIRSTGDLLSSRSNEAGRYGFAVPVGAVRLSIYTPGPTIDYVDTTIDVEVTELPFVHDVAFRAPNLVGQVLDADGVPSGGASVETVSDVGPGDWVSWAGADRDGRFAMLLPPGEHRLVAEPDDADDPAGIRTAHRVTVGEAGTTQTVITLDAPVAPAYELQRLSIDLGGQPAYRVTDPVISGDGGVVVVRAGSELAGCDCEERRLPFPPPGGTSWDEALFVHDVASGEQERLTAPNGAALAPNEQVVLDHDGGRVAWVTSDSELVGDDAWWQRMLVLDRVADELIVIEPPAPASPEDDPAYVAELVPALSGDGRTLATAVDHVDADGTWVRSLEVVRLGTAGDVVDRELLPLAHGSVNPRPVISSDGTTLAWLDHGGDGWQLHVRDLDTGVEEQPRAVWPEGAAWDAPHTGPDLSDDGRVVVYPADRDEEGADGYVRQRGKVRVWDRESGEDRLVTLFAADGGPRSDGVRASGLSGDGESLIVMTDGAHPEQEMLQAWRVDLGADVETLVSADGRGQAGDSGIDTLSTSGDPGVVAIGTRSSNLTGVGGGLAPEGGISDEQVVLAITEESPPQWPDGSLLTVGDGDLGSTSVRIAWTPATDNVRVTRYVVSVDGVPAGSTDGETTSLRLTGLEPDTDYELSVEAIDSRGSSSTGGPTRVVRTLPADAVDLRPLDAVVAAGGRVSLAWEAPAVADEVLVRRYVGDTQIDEVALAGDADRLELTGLAAETAYDFQVFVRVGTQVRAFTERVEVTTRALTLTSLSWTPELAGSRARRGTTVPVVAVAEPGRSVWVTVDFESWFDESHQLLDAPVTRTSVVPMLEDPAAPGTYRGGFELVDGIARLSGMTGTVTDGAGHFVDRAATRAGLDVSADLLAEIDAPAGSIPGGYAVLDGPTFYGQELGGGASLEFAGVEPRSYRLIVYSAVGDELARSMPVPARRGLAAEVVVEPGLPARVAIEVAGQDGDSMFGLVEARDANSGQWLGGGRLLHGRWELGGLRAGQDVRITVRHHRSTFLQNTVRDVELEWGDNLVQAVAVPVDRNALTGRVTYQDGRPVEAAVVRLTQRREGEDDIFTTSTGSDGTYALQGLAAPGTLSVTAGRLKGESPVDLTAGAESRDLELEGVGLYQVRLRLFARPAGSASELGPIAIDWRTAVHYGVRFSLGGRDWTGYSVVGTAEDGSTVVSVPAHRGSDLQWCISGREARVRSTCVTERLGDSGTVTMEMHAGPAVPLTAVATSGAPRGGGVRARIYSLAAPEGLVLISDQTHGLRIHETIEEPGDYVIELSQGEWTSRRSFSVAADQTRVDLGSIPLERAVRFGGPDNEVRTARSTVIPGSVVELRASWRNGAPGVAASTVARIAVPPGTTLLAESLLLDGAPVVATPGDGYADVPLGDIASGVAGTLHYRLRVHDDATGLLAGAVDLRYGTGPVVERLVPAVLSVLGVTVQGPATTGSARLPLSGRAPAGATVSLRQDGALLGQAVAGPGGHWRQVVDLAIRRSEPMHTVVATTVVDGNVYSATHRVRFERERPVAISVSMYQVDAGFSNGRRFTFDPRDGAAKFPFVFVPHQQMIFDVTFDEPDHVRSATIVVGANRVTATRQRDGVFRAQGILVGGLGPVRLRYDADALPYDLTEPELSPEELRDELPAPFHDVTVSDVVTPSGSDEGPRTGSFTAALPALGGAEARATLRVTRDYYTPTQQDLDRVAATGVPLYDVSFGRSGNTLSYQFVVPVAALPGAGRSAVFDRLAPIPDQRVAVRFFSAATKLEFAFARTTELDSVLSGAGSGDKFGKLGDVLGELNGCSPQKIEHYTDRAENLALWAAAGDVAGAVFNVAALVFAPASFGLGALALGVAGVLMDKAIGYAIEEATASLRADIASDADCEDDEDDDDDQDDDDDDDEEDDHEDLADPTWIYDPSGYTFEGTRSARIGGVTATLLTAPTENGPWTAWDATWFGQENPQTTDDEGRYGWDVPEGWWKVAYEKDGYLPAYSRTLRVLPPHLDVDVSMVRTGFPHVTSATMSGGAVEMTFDRMVRSDSLDAMTVTDGAGAVVPGTWTAVDAGDDEAGSPLQRGARWTPTATLPAGTVLTLTVDQVLDYADRPMLAPYAVDLTVPVTPGGGSGGGPGGGPSDPPAEPEVPAAPSTVSATAGERSARVSWDAPDDGGSPITSYVVTIVETGRQVVAGADATSIVVDELAPGVGHRFTVTARNQVGTGPASAPSNTIVPTAVAPETVLSDGPDEGQVVTARRASLTATTLGPAPASWICTLDGEERACPGGTLELRRLGSGTHTASLAAVDADGDVDPTPVTRSWIVPRDDRVLDRRGAWRARSDERAFDGTYLETSKRGASLTTRVERAEAISLVVSTGRRHGRVVVWLGDRRLRAVDLSSGAPGHRRVLAVSTFEKAQSGRLRVEVRSKGKVVRIDGLAVSRAPTR